MRRLSGDDPEVNEEWITDKDRFSHRYADSTTDSRYPMVRDAGAGELRPRAGRRPSSSPRVGSPRP